jgi:hypothetical protein
LTTNIIINKFSCQLSTGFLVYKFTACSKTNQHHIHNHDTNNSTTLVSSIISHSSNNNKPITNSTISDGTPTFPLTIDPNLEIKVPEVKENVRLPRSLKPLAYDIKLIPFLIENNFTFNGDVTILFEVLEECENITLHAESLKILDKNVEVRLHQNTINNTVIGKKKQYFVESKQFYVVEVDQKLKKGTVYELVIRFTGILNDYLQGFYRSSYSDGKNVR